jgi:hypothetical protein
MPARDIANPIQSRPKAFKTTAFRRAEVTDRPFCFWVPVATWTQRGPRNPSGYFYDEL